MFNMIGQPLRFPYSPSVSFAARDLIRGLLSECELGAHSLHMLFVQVNGEVNFYDKSFFRCQNFKLIS